jgi:hypothetical protein
VHPELDRVLVFDADVGILWEEEIDGRLMQPPVELVKSHTLRGKEMIGQKAMAQFLSVCAILIDLVRVENHLSPVELQIEVHHSARALYRQRGRFLLDLQT